MFLPVLVLVVLILILGAFVTRVSVFWRPRCPGIGRLGPEFNFGGHGPGSCGYRRSGSKRRQRGGGGTQGGAREAQGVGWNREPSATVEQDLGVVWAPNQ